MPAWTSSSYNLPGAVAAYSSCRARAVAQAGWVHHARYRLLYREDGLSVAAIAQGLPTSKTGLQHLPALASAWPLAGTGDGLAAGTARARGPIWDQGRLASPDEAAVTADMGVSEARLRSDAVIASTGVTVVESTTPARNDRPGL